MQHKARNILMTGVLLGLSAGAMADPAVYRDGVMVIDSGVVIGARAQAYFSDIEMTTDAAGKLIITKATQLPLVYIDTVDATVVDNAEERSVKLTIAGNKSVPCVSLADVAVTRKDNVFTVVVAETVQGPAESCIAVLDPFEIEVPLDVADLPAGSYDVKVNGDAVSAEFDLAAPALWEGM